MLFKIPSLIFLLLLVACVTAASHKSKIWSSSIAPNKKEAIRRYENRARLENGLIYGDSIRQLDLSQLCPDELDRQLVAQSCILHQTTLKGPAQTPLLIYACPDGGAVKVKPLGDPTNRLRPQPHMSKFLYNPSLHEPRTFDDELVKINNHGLALPKWATDLAKDANVEEWANDAHTDVPKHCPPSLIKEEAKDR